MVLSCLTAKSPKASYSRISGNLFFLNPFSLNPKEAALKSPYLEKSPQKIGPKKT